MRYQIDIETLGLKPNSVIMSVGICNTNGVGKQFYVPKAPQLHVGRCVDQTTLAWWNEPERVQLYNHISDCCHDAFMNGATISGLHLFLADFFAEHDDSDNPEDREVWMNSPAFDGVMLESLFTSFGLDVPWHYRNPRDFRTLKNLALAKNPDIQLPEEPQGLHDALVDARWQMQQTHIYLKALGI
jgi:exodeoxyribonuclease VIII